MSKTDNINQYKILPTQITIDISNMCNAMCPFCARQYLKNNNDKKYMPKEMFYEIMEQVKRIKSIEIISLSAFGEALMHPNFDEFVDYITSLNYKTLIISNMSLAHLHYNALLKLSNIMFSVEGWDKTSYEKYRQNLNYNQVYNNIKQFDKLIKQRRKQNKTTPSRMINCLLTKETNINAFKKNWSKYTDYINFNTLQKILNWDDENKCFEQITPTEFENKLFTPFPNLNVCKDPFNVIFIRANGDMSMCCYDYNCKLDFGTFKNIEYNFYNNINLNKIRKELKEKNINICKNCIRNKYNENLSSQFNSET